MARSTNPATRYPGSSWGCSQPSSLPLCGSVMTPLNSQTKMACWLEWPRQIAPEALPTSPELLRPSGNPPLEALTQALTGQNHHKQNALQHQDGGIGHTQAALQ